MYQVMNDLAELFGFNYVPTTFPEFFLWLFLATGGVLLVACMIKAILYICFNPRRFFKS